METANWGINLKIVNQVYLESARLNKCVIQNSRHKQERREKRPIQNITIMGSCGSTICSETNQQKAKEKELVKIHKRRNKMRLKQAAVNSTEVSNSVEVIDCESEKSPTSSLKQSPNDNDSRQETSPRMNGTASPLENKVEDAQIPKAADPKKLFSGPVRASNLKNTNANIKWDQKRSNDTSTKEHSCAPEAPVRHFGYTAPLLRPSPWKEVYLTYIKPKEERAEERMTTRRQHRRTKKKPEVDKKRAQKIRILRKELAKTIDSVKRDKSSKKRCNSPTNLELLFEPAPATLFWNRDSSTSVASASTTTSDSQSSDFISFSDDDSSHEQSSDGLSYEGYDDSCVMAAHGDLIRTLKSLGFGKIARHASRLLVRKQSMVSPIVRDE